MHSVIDILQITEALVEQKLIDETILDKIKTQIGQ